MPAEMKHQVEAKLLSVADGGVSTSVIESKGALNKTLAIAELVREQENKAQTALGEVECAG